MASLLKGDFINILSYMLKESEVCCTAAVAHYYMGSSREQIEFWLNLAEKSINDDFTGYGELEESEPSPLDTFFDRPLGWSKHYLKVLNFSGKVIPSIAHIAPSVARKFFKSLKDDEYEGIGNIIEDSMGFTKVEEMEKLISEIRNHCSV
jgi:hypothetical protein